MPISYQWDNDDRTIIKFIYEDPVTVDEIRQMDGGVAAMLDSVRHPVVAIADTRLVTMLPQDIMTSYPLLARNRGFTHRNLRASVMIVRNAFFESLMAIFSRLYGKLHFARSLEEAYEMIEDGKI
jgi:hypothetical protein